MREAKRKGYDEDDRLCKRPQRTVNINQSGCDALITFSQGEQSYRYINLAVILSDWRAESWAAGTSGGGVYRVRHSSGGLDWRGSRERGSEGWVSTHHGEDQTTKEGGVLELGFLEDSFPCYEYFFSLLLEVIISFTFNYHLHLYDSNTQASSRRTPVPYRRILPSPSPQSHVPSKKTTPCPKLVLFGE